ELEVTVIAAGFPKGSAETMIPKEYLRERKTISTPPEQAPAPAKPVAKPEVKVEVKPEGKDEKAAKPAEKKPEPVAASAGEELPLLFPDEPVETSRNTSVPESDEDINIPAYLRKKESNSGSAKGIPLFMQRRKKT